ncbi:MAG TPA: ABC transporter ATP-binding protein [Stellaceae bacterium]
MLACRDISVFYGPIQALDGVALQVGQGECVALLGANGAGKTTLLRTISGLIRQRSGTITLHDTVIDRVAPEQRVRMGLAHVPERRRIFPGLTVRENLEVATSGWRRMGQGIDSDLAKVFALFPRLKERAGQRGWSLSGGEQQMLAVGRALMSRPRVLLLDEPSLGLAPLIAEELYERLAEIGGTGVTILVVEQNTAIALSIASRAYVLENGRIVLEGAARELADHPRIRAAYLGR